ncbi:cyclic AMP-responsive element-binding protein 3-like protein 2 isoform X2 [Exaiptasia diaphana]|uniref:BZIP domain-containing protein n=1 Tax=Exaiptasia diaphana TaxID=2652724 RepID=A0A913XUD5_EXADI|nr:cyclic AMP-responsive element-binding protein 3-like protein 2 isoform X2 [Exaiptasia diaphana]
MDSPLDLTIVKKEPGLSSLCPSDSGLFDSMMQDGFHDNHFQSINNEEVPVDWLSSFFDEVPCCMEQSLPNYNLPEYTSSSGLNYSSKNHSIGLSGLSMDPMPALPEDCSNESLYCPTPSTRCRSPDFDHTRALITDSESSDDSKTNLFGRHSLCPPFDSTQNSFHLEGTEMDRVNAMNGCAKNELDADSGENESGYDSTAHSPTSTTPSTPPREIENDLSGSSAGETTPPSIRTQDKQPFYLTEEERRTLIAEGLPVPAGLPLTKVEERALKKVRRKIKNKISAQESRRKKKEYMETLEKRVEKCSSENMDLRKKLDGLENTNRSLINQLQKLQSMINNTKTHRQVSARSTQTSTCLMVVVLCFAVFIGSWSPLTKNGLTLPSPAESDRTVAKYSVDYSTPSVRSRVLLSVDEADEAEFAPTPSIMDAMAAYLKPGPTITAVDNDTNNYVAVETSSTQAKPRDGLSSAL